jgi:hypothetical protein
MVAVLLTFGVIPKLASGSQQSRACSESLPLDVRQQLQAKFPQWRPKQVSDLQSDDQRLWLEAHAKECLGIAIGHFESKNALSYAILLVPDTKPSDGYKVVVSGKHPNNTCRFRILDHNDTHGDSGLVISKAGPGKHDDFESSKSIRTNLDGIEVEWLEKSSVLYYWSGAKYRTLQTSD